MSAIGHDLFNGKAQKDGAVSHDLPILPSMPHAVLGNVPAIAVQERQGTRVG